MIIDSILDRRADNKDGFDKWTVDDLRYVYDEAMSFKFNYLSRAIDGGTNKDIQEALCRYIDENGYRPSIKRYVRTKDWLPKGM